MVLKVFSIFLILSSVGFASEHFAKLEPIETVTIKAQINGAVLSAKSDLEGKIANGVIIQLDDTLNKSDLIHTRGSLSLTQEMIRVNSGMLDPLKKNAQKKKKLYERVSPLASTSVSQKDTLYSAYIAAKSQYNSTFEKILSLKNQRITLEQKINLLSDNMSKKSIKVSGVYLYKLMVKKGEYVTIGTPVATIQNINKAKLVLYLSAEELKGIDKKRVFINGKETALKFSKIWKVADSKYISSYRAEIILKPFERFSKLVKVEIK